MRYRDSDALFLPARPPEHAAPVSLLRRRRSPRQRGGRLRRLTRQTLQLFLTSIAWAAGLGLVIGSIVLVATAAAPRHAVPPLSAVQRGEQNSMPLVPPGTAFPRASGNHVLDSFSGNASRTTRRFIVTAKLRWQVRWSYRCGPRTEDKQFTLLAADVRPAGSSVTPITRNFTASGRGSGSLIPSGRRHYLEVISACSWHVKVIQAG